MAEVWLVPLLVCSQCDYVGQPFLRQVTTRLCRSCASNLTVDSIEHMACMASTQVSDSGCTEVILTYTREDQYLAFVFAPRLTRVVG